jgi:lysophospholipase L1-like esterase
VPQFCVSLSFSEQFLEKRGQLMLFRQTFQYHPNIGYTFVPGLKMRVEHEGGGYLVRVNGAGFRNDREFEAHKRPGTFRILLFGDSVTAGQGVSNKDRYSDLLETMVPGLEVYNLGMSGSGTDQQYLIFQEFAHRYEHDLVVIGVYIENIRRIVAHYRPHRNLQDHLKIRAKPYFTLSDREELVRHHFPVPREPLDEKDMPPEERETVDHGGPLGLLRGVFDHLSPTVKGRVTEIARKVTWIQPFPAYDDPNSFGWRLMRAILVQLIKESAVPVVICPIPVYRHIEELTDPTSYQARFRELTASTGALLHDPLPDYWRLSMAERKSLRFKTDIHPSPSSHRVLAQSLARCIQPLVMGEKAKVCL